MAQHKKKRGFLNVIIIERECMKSLEVFPGLAMSAAGPLMF